MVKKGQMKNFNIRLFPEVKQLAFTLAGNEYYAFDPFNKKVVVKKQVEQII